MHSPFDASLADRIVIAIASGGGDPDGFMRRVFAGIWAEERDLADADTLAGLLAATGHDAQRVMAQAGGDAALAAYDANPEAAVAADVFGAPSYVLDGEVFWGQDRIELLDDALRAGRAPFRPG
jgi:2-hydroxychromene-2-carboxylate isomerase